MVWPKSRRYFLGLTASAALMLCTSCFPPVRVIFGVGQDGFDARDLKFVVQLRDQPVAVAANVENGEPAYAICMREVCPHFDQIPPCCTSGDLIPPGQSWKRVAVAPDELWR